MARLCYTPLVMSDLRTAGARMGPFREPAGIFSPRLLLIGAAGRNAGKTLLATRIISSLPGMMRVAGAKVTTVQDEEHGCPRGGDGCGACSSFDGPYAITDETGEAEGKDTTRLFDAGARPVRWLCVREGHLVLGARNLLSGMDHEIPIVCESNSLRRVVEPGLFIIVRRSDRRQIKRSCARVWDLADAVVRFDGEDLDLSVQDLGFVDGRWTLRRRATAYILADPQRDGDARRDSVQLVAERLAVHFRRVMVLTRCALNPLSIVAEALASSEHDVNLFVDQTADDVSVDLLHRLLRAARSGADVVLPDTAGGENEARIAVYNRSARPAIERALAQGTRQVLPTPTGCQTLRVDVSPAVRSGGV